MGYGKGSHSKKGRGNHRHRRSALRDHSRRLQKVGRARSKVGVRKVSRKRVRKRVASIETVSDRAIYAFDSERYFQQ